MQLFYVFKDLFFCFCFYVKTFENVQILEKFYKLVMQI